MKQQLFELLANQGDLSWQEIVLNVAVSMVIGMVIFASYAISHRGTIYSKKFNVSLVALTVLTTTVMTVIGNNIALSLGMVGALSIVRFRTAIKDSRDTIYIFWTIIAGICCGVQNFFVAAIGSLGVFVVLYVMGSIKNDARVLVVIRGARTIESSVESIMYKSFERKAILKVKNTTKDSIEFIYEISQKTLHDVEIKNPEITNSFYAIDGIEYVNFVAQNDEITG